MADYVISCCTPADLDKEHLLQRDIKHIYFHYELGGQFYDDDVWQSMSADSFYQAMADGAETRTSQVNAGEFQEYFEKFLKEGQDIVHVSLSSGISGVLNSAVIAKQNLEERYPERKIYVIDSLGASAGYGLLMDKMADLRDGGMSIDELAAWVEAHKLNVQSWVFVSDLKYLVRGGRLSKASGAIGSVLSICPLIEVDLFGKLSTRAKVRTKKKVMEAAIRQMELSADKGLNYDEKCYIIQSACMDEAMGFADQIHARFPKAQIKICNIGPTIGCHVGPGTMGLFFWGSRRIDGVK
ncbi:MAG: DegV family protein [Brotaphodocola sp.]